MAGPAVVELAGPMPAWRDDLINTLRGAGLEPEIRAAQTEERSVAQTIETLMAVSLATGQGVVLADQIVAALESLAKRILKGRRVPARSFAVLYKPDGSVLRRVEMPDPEE